MAMKNRILAILPTQDILTCNSDSKYIMDYTNVTKSKRGLEWSAIKPTDIAAFTIKKELIIDISFCPFRENTLLLNNKEQSHCEGILFPTINNDLSWILLLELKYPKRKSLADNLNKAKEQLFKTLLYLRERNIIKKQQLVYLISSAPNHIISSPFNNFSMTPVELKNIKTEMKAIVRCTNEITIVNYTKIKV
jgi:hypothetical protein